MPDLQAVAIAENLVAGGTKNKRRSWFGKGPSQGQEADAEFMLAKFAAKGGGMGGPRRASNEGMAEGAASPGEEAPLFASHGKQASAVCTGADQLSAVFGEAEEPQPPTADGAPAAQGAGEGEGGAGAAWMLY